MGNLILRALSQKSLNCLKLGADARAENSVTIPLSLQSYGSLCSLISLPSHTVAIPRSIFYNLQRRWLRALEEHKRIWGNGK